jgi:hypothetical protein
MAYILIYLLDGELPWQNITAADEATKTAKICEMKTSLPVSELCRKVPREFADFLTEVKQLQYTEPPPYASYRQKFRDLFLKSGYVYDYRYDWTTGPIITKVRKVPPKRVRLVTGSKSLVVNSVPILEKQEVPDKHAVRPGTSASSSDSSDVEDDKHSKSKKGTLRSAQSEAGMRTSDH